MAATPKRKYVNWTFLSDKVDQSSLDRLQTLVPEQARYIALILEVNPEQISIRGYIGFNSMRYKGGVCKLLDLQETNLKPENNYNGKGWIAEQLTAAYIPILFPRPANVYFFERGEVPVTGRKKGYDTTLYRSIPPSWECYCPYRYDSRKLAYLYGSPDMLEMAIDEISALYLEHEIYRKSLLVRHWLGYTGQRVVIVDHAVNELSVLNQVLNLSTCGPMIVETDTGYRHITAELVIITSHTRPFEVWGLYGIDRFFNEIAYIGPQERLKANQKLPADTKLFHKLADKILEKGWADLGVRKTEIQKLLPSIFRLDTPSEKVFSAAQREYEAEYMIPQSSFEVDDVSSFGFPC